MTHRAIFTSDATSCPPLGDWQGNGAVLSCSKKLQIEAQCDTAWNTGIISGPYVSVGMFGDYTIYEKQTIDANGNWWFFYYDTTRGGWEFSYTNERVVPGVTLMETTVSTLTRPG